MARTRKRGKIPQEDWPSIMKRYEAGETLASIARTYEASPPAISYIVSRSRAQVAAGVPPPTAEEVKKPPLPPPYLRPRAIKGVPSVFGYAWSEKKTIVLKPSSTNLPRFPFPSSERDYAQRLEASRMLAEDLASDLEQRPANIRDDYRVELIKYAGRLPSHGEDGNILLADAAARTLRDLFAAEAEFLPVWVAARLKTILEHHIGLRAYYPEVEIFYRDVRSGRLQRPLPLDAFSGVVHAVEAHTPEIFDPSVISSIDESEKSNPIITHAETSTREPNQPIPPPDLWVNLIRRRPTITRQRVWSTPSGGSSRQERLCTRPPGLGGLLMMRSRLM